MSSVVTYGTDTGIRCEIIFDLDWPETIKAYFKMGYTIEKMESKVQQRKEEYSSVLYLKKPLEKTDQ